MGECCVTDQARAAISPVPRHTVVAAKSKHTSHVVHDMYRAWLANSLAESEGSVSIHASRPAPGEL
jgi:hypothetical protein